MWAHFFGLIVEFFSAFQFFMFVDQFERHVILRKGIFHREVGPGFRWIWPTAYERDISVNVMPEPVYLDVQSLHTKDDYACNIQVGITWRVIDARKYTLDFEDTDDIITMICSGIVTDMVHSTTWKGLREPGAGNRFKGRFNRKVRKYGIEVDETVMQDFGAGRADRMWHEGISLDFGEE